MEKEVHKMMNKTKLECPKCHWIFEEMPPDSEHLVGSIDKPQKNILGKVEEQNHVCRNQRCKQSMTIYWYMPLDHFARM